MVGKEMPLISIIIPSYNSQKYIEETIKSCLYQSHQNLEIIAVDDGSIDNTVEIIQQFPVKLITQKNAGACAARNRGFQESKGDYIQFLDADDLLSPNKIEEQLKQLNGRDDITSNGRWGRFYTDDPFSEEISWGPHDSLQRDHDPVSWLCCNHMSQTACWLTPRKLIEKAGPWDESLSQNQDGEFFARVVAQSCEVKYCSSAKVYYRSKLTGSITSKVKEKKALESFYQTCQSFEQVLFSLEDSERTRLAVADKYQQFIYRAYPQCPDLVKAAEGKVEELGGSQWPPYRGGRFHNLLMDVFGWKFPAKLKHVF